MQESTKRIGGRLVLGAAALALVAGFACGFFFVRASAKTPLDAAAAGAGKAAQGRAQRDVRYKIPVSMTQPKLGPDDALVTIVEWCDLRAKACRDVDAPMNRLMQRYAGRLRWVFRQLPDPKRGDSALVHDFARGMFQQSGKFWEARERLMQRPDDAMLTKRDLREIAGELGADWAALEKGIEERTFARYVGVDILFAGKFGVDAGPAFFVNGRRLSSVATGALDQALSTLIEQELVEADWHIRRGVAKTDVYREITKDGLWAVNDDPAARKAANAQSTVGASKDP